MSREQSVRISFVGLGLLAALIAGARVSGSTAAATAKLWANGHCDP